MLLTIKSAELESEVTVTIEDERRELNALLSMLDGEKVSELELSDIKGERLPRALTSVSGLQSLTFRRCHCIQALPQDLRKCAALKSLSFIQCADFYDLRGISAFKNLEDLHISGCDCFDTIPDEISQMTHLQALDLSYCTSLGWMELDNLPRSLRLLDLHGDINAEFDDDAAEQLHLVSVQIQDAVRIPNLNEAPVLKNISSLLHKSIEPPSTGSLDGSD